MKEKEEKLLELLKPKVSSGFKIRKKWTQRLKFRFIPKVRVLHYEEEDCLN